MIQVVAAVLGLLLPILFAVLGGTEMLGAHIWWDVKVALVGAPFGLAVAYILGGLWRPKIGRVLLFLALLVIAFVTARGGQASFAASYGEDALAGTFWYFGWIATCAAAAASIYTITAR